MNAADDRRPGGRRAGFGTTTLGLALATGAALLPGVAPADDSGLYLGIGAGVSRLDPQSRTDALTTGERDDTGVHAFVGYDFNRWLSGEAYVADLGSAGIDFLGDDVGDVDYRVYGIRALGYLWNSRSGLLPGNDTAAGRDGASVFLASGIGGLDTDSTLSVRTDHRAHVSFGVGAEYGFARGLSVRAELAGFDTDARYASVALLKRFGARTSATGPAVSETPELAKAVAPERPPADMQTYFMPIVPPYLYFGFDEESLDAESIAKLEAFADEVQASGLDVEINGHADAIGPEAYNQDLSLRRALAVRDRLVEAGVDPARVSFSGFGETRPLESNATETGRAFNRRADFHLR